LRESAVLDELREKAKNTGAAYILVFNANAVPRSVVASIDTRRIGIPDCLKLVMHGVEPFSIYKLERGEPVRIEKMEKEEAL